MYAIQVVRRKTTDRGYYHTTTAEGLPTFYLDENVQGIVSEAHAVEVARRIIGDVDATVTAVRA